ncbi:MAG: hypothetical protein U0075_13565 [Thermomicrobiales bacterium]
MLVTLTGLMPGAHYVLSGAVFEADGWVENADFCCSLDPQTVVITDLGHHYRRLNRQAIAADLGLLKGMGPARDEEVSAKGVELFARIWLRDLTRRKQAGPWDSPSRVVASRSQAGWTSSPQQDDNPLMLPHGGRSATNHESVGPDAPRGLLVRSGIQPSDGRVASSVLRVRAIGRHVRRCRGVLPDWTVDAATLDGQIDAAHQEYRAVAKTRYVRPGSRAHAIATADTSPFAHLC